MYIYSSNFTYLIYSKLAIYCCRFLSIPTLDYYYLEVETVGANEWVWFSMFCFSIQNLSTLIKFISCLSGLH